MKPGAALSAMILLACGAMMAGCSGASSSGSSPTTARNAETGPHAVGLVTDTFVDTHRSTPVNGTYPGSPHRTLVTTILYPATGAISAANPVEAATPDRSAGPYPLIVFAHGLGATPQIYEGLLAQWASAGYVVAAPLFPLTNADAPGGPDAGDVTNQPGDMSYVIGAVEQLSARHSGTLAGLLQPGVVGAAGHSNGAITTLGLVANTCCRDARVKAAVVMAGDAEVFPGGHYDFAHAPPMLLVHGTSDELIPYNQGVAVFNRARGPKGLVTLEGGDHDSAAGFAASSSGTVVRATEDFFAGYLKGDKAALARLPTDEQQGVTVRFVQRPGSTVTIPTLPTPKVNLRASVTPSTNLMGGQTVTVRWSGYTPANVINILQCSGADQSLTNSSLCDFTHAHILMADPTGAGSVEMQVITGNVGTGICDASHQGCFVVVNNASDPDPSGSLKLPISFAP